MAKSRLLLSHVFVLLCAGLCSLAAQEQKIDPGLKALLENSLRLEKRLSPVQRHFLSSVTLNRFALAHQILDTRTGAGKILTAPAPKREGGNRVMPQPAGGAPAMVPISSPAFDYTLSRGGGFSQNDTSTAWCGPNIVSGYNDSSAILLTMNSGVGGTSFSGIAHSGDGGKTFSDLGYLDPGPESYDFLVGNPSVACASASRFYYASMYATAVQVDANDLVFKEAIGINISSDGGKTWSAPIATVLRAPVHILERESLAVDPTNSLRLFISYTDIDFATALGGSCAGDTQMLIELVSSADGGETWGTPQTVEKVCGSSGNAVNGPQVAVDASGLVYVSYLYYDNANSREMIRLSSSEDHGASFHPPVEVSKVVPAGSDGMLQGFFLSNEYPTLAVDRSNGKSRGTVYVAWTDGRNRSQPDLFSGSGVYNFADVLLAKSVDQGQHWSVPVGVSPAAKDASRDQFMPGVAVDASGKLAMCYSDRRNDPQNDAIDHYCSVSQDGGATFSDLRVTSRSWSPSHSTDLVLNQNYMQDYDVVSPDWTGESPGFFAGFQFQSYGNPNAYGARF